MKIDPQKNISHLSFIMSDIMSHNSSQSFSNTQIFLGTAIILVRGANDNWHKAEVLLDSGAQSYFINNFLRKLKCKTKTAQLSILGVKQT